MKRHVFHRQRGFSLVELIIVIVLIGIIGGVLAMQVLPAIRAYLIVGQRAALTNQADTALRRIVGDVRRAVPNSLRLGSSQCLELMPTSDGGRYRTAPDFSVNPPAGAFLDDAAKRNAFDVLTPFSKRPNKGDMIVIANQDPDELYKGANSAAIEKVTDLSSSGTGLYHIDLESALRIPDGYAGGRFVVVPQAEQTVAYVCKMPEQGSGTLYRIAYSTLQESPRCIATDNDPIVATGVESCSFVYSANQGATQESGFVQLQLTLGGKGESVPLTLGAHVANVP